MTSGHTSALSLLLIACLAPATAAQNDASLLATESIALLSYASMSNLGAADPSCSTGRFEKFNIHKLVDNEIAPVIDRLAAARPGDITQQQRKEMIEFLKNVPNHPNVANGVETTYRMKKSEAITAYGETGGCPALATMVKTVIQQKRLILQRM